MSEITLPSGHKIRNSNPGVWGRTRYLSVREAPNNTEFYERMEKKHLFATNRRDREANPEL